VTLGGPAFDDPGDDFEPGLFIKPGIIFTSRGCPHHCPFCLVPKREGNIMELPIRPGHIIADNNLLACSRPHIEAVFDMLSQQRRGAVFSGGLDATLLQPWHIDLIRGLPRLGGVWFACDSAAAIKPLQRAAEMLTWLDIKKKRCYCMIGLGSIQEAEARLERVYALGFLPFAQLYRPADSCQAMPPYDWHWKALARKWSRPAAYRGRK
jgi:hypothetical protein